MDEGAGALAELAERLVASGLAPTARELAEALWLARHVAPARLRPVDPEPPSRPPEPMQPDRANPRPVPPAGEPPATHGAPTEDGPRTRLHSDTPGPGPRQASPRPAPTPGDTSVRVRAPMATALPRSLRLQRALRPLQRYRPPVRAAAHHIDEQATAERAAETGLLLPVLRPVTRRQARLRLLMDASTSTGVWDRTLGELAQICAGTGAFREVVVHYVHERAGALLVGPDRAPDRASRTADQLRDPTGHQLTLVLSDCAGPLWRDGAMQRLLWNWAQAAPVAVVQPLPQRMWRRTHLPAAAGTLRRREGLGARMEFAAPGDPADGLPVPVLALTGAAFLAWARLVSGGTGLTLPAAAGRVRADQEPTPPRPADRAPQAPELLRAFRLSASHHAVQFVVSLSAVPLTTPVMQLVQRAMLPDTGPDVLAEVLLSGLLTRGPADDWYAFRPGVRELLLQLLPKGDALLVLRHCGDYVDRHFGRRARNFPALALAELSGDAPPEGDEAGVPAAFAEVSRLVVRRYGGSDPAGTGDTGERDGTRPGEVLRIVHAGYDRPWAAWAERVLGAHGHRATLVRWHPGRRPLVEALATLRDLELVQPSGRILLMLSEHLLQQGRRDPDEWREAFRQVVGGSPGLFVAVVLSERLELRVRLNGLLPVATTAVSVGEADAERRLLAALSTGTDAGAWQRRITATPRFPGSKPAVWRGVPARDRHFTGRDDLLDALPEKLRQARRAGVVCVLSGAPGSGKTAVAVEYAHRYGSDYDVVHWLPNTGHGNEEARERTDRLVAEFAGTTGRSSGARVPDRRLVVLDDWDHSGSAGLSQLAPHAHVLATTRRPADPLDERNVPLGPFERAESLEYVMRALAVSAEEAETIADFCGDRPGALAQIVEGRPESAPSEREFALGAPSRPAELEELGRRAVVGVSDTRKGSPLRGVGFFVAPGWVLTLWPVVGLGGTAWVRTYDGRLVEGEVVRLDSEFDGPDPVLIRLRERFEHECLWLDDHAGTDVHRVLALGVTAREPWQARGEVTGRGELLHIGGFRASVTSMGGPVLDLDRAAVVGALWGPGDAVSDGSLAVPLPLLGDGDLARQIMREHDRHHLRREPGTRSGPSWTSLQQGLHQEADGDLTPELRTRLYGILAALEPPTGEREMRLLLPGPASRLPADGLRAWRDGVRLLIAQGGGLAEVALYAAHVWSARIDAPDGHDDPGALSLLRTWMEDVVRGLPDGAARSGVSELLDARRRESRMPVLVEIRETRGGHRWNVSRYGGSRRWPMPHVSSGHARAGLREALAPSLTASLRLSRAFDQPLYIEFSMPYDLLAEPVDEWLLDGEPQEPPLGERASVTVALEHPLLPPTAQDDSLRLLRWAGVANGPLVPIPLSHDSATLELQVMTSPMTAVPVYCGCLGGGGQGLAVLEATGANGHALVLWRRGTDHEDCHRFVERAQELVRGARSAEGLLAAVWTLRLRDDPDAAWARGIALLYEPPGRPSYLSRDL